ncbi:uncharacterized protein LOC130945481 [Arachis stenosperma]|uniref:uncharacterized protein LOC130945481 n=1 Tax=Arachis stenosperma TaxID=217475 RepID=UPI0025AD70EA|nr:uncharacterized protein LOC130945481 [Arachis stenosperma]
MSDSRGVEKVKGKDLESSREEAHKEIRKEKQKQIEEKESWKIREIEIELAIQKIQSTEVQKEDTRKEVPEGDNNKDVKKLEKKQEKGEQKKWKRMAREVVQEHNSREEKINPEGKRKLGEGAPMEIIEEETQPKKHQPSTPTAEAAKQPCRDQ